MSRIRGKNTAPELAVRKLVYSLGYRYRLYGKNLPGKPDLVFKGKKKIIFVHGCFWHYHGCKKGMAPKTKLEYWLPKLERNKTRDKETCEKLAALKWHVLTVWQCEINDPIALKRKLVKFLSA